VKSKADLTEPTTKQDEPGKQKAAGEQSSQDQIDPKTGLTYGELEKMDFSEIWELLKSRQQ
jgi:hypothetical protein